MEYKILIVDDSIITSEMIEKVIKLSGFPVDKLFFAKNGKIAEDILKKNSIDIIFTDLIMPVMDGFSLIEKIKKDPKLSDIPIIIISSMGKEEYILKGLKLGAKNYIKKPFKPEQIKEIIQKTLGVEINGSNIESTKKCDF